MRGVVIVMLLVGLALPARAQVATPATRLTLAEAIRAAWAVDPATTQAQVANERAKLATLRSQLDRVSVRVDGSLQELYNKANIGGPRIHYCSFGTVILQLDETNCTSMGGTASVLGSTAATQGLFNLQAQVNVPVFSGFRVEATVKRNQILENVSAAAARQTRRDIAVSTMRAYWSVRRLALLIDAQTAAIDRLKDSEKATEDRIKAGLAPGIDRNRARSRRLAQQSTVIDLVGQLREAEVQLAVALGLTGHVELVDPPIAVAAPNCNDAQASDIALRDRPEIMRARLQVAAQAQAVRIARSGYFPQLNGVFLFQYGNNAFSIGSGARSLSAAANPFSRLAGNLTAGGSLTMNFFDMLNTYTAVKDAKLEEARLAAETNRARRSVDTEVQSTCARLERLVNRRAIQEEVRDVAKDNMTIMEQRYRNGDALLIELLDSQLELTTAELNLVDLVAQLQPAWLELAAARGLDLGDTQVAGGNN